VRSNQDPPREDFKDEEGLVNERRAEFFNSIVVPEIARCVDVVVVVVYLCY